MRTHKLTVKKRGARGVEPLKFDKITSRIEHLCYGLDSIDPVLITMNVVKGIYDGITTADLDVISATIAAEFGFENVEYSVLASRILVSNLHKNTPSSFSAAFELQHKYRPYAARYLEFVRAYSVELDRMIVHDADNNFSYMGFKTLEFGYLRMSRDEMIDERGQIYLTGDGVEIWGADADAYEGALKKKYVSYIIDRPQYMYLRVAISMWIGNLEEIKKCYKLMSQHYFTHATPTLFNACSENQQLGSCFLLGTGDSIESINQTIADAALISKGAGGIGIHMSNIRCAGQIIKSTGGPSSGLKPQLKIYNDTALTWNQGGKRPGSFAPYIEMWHGDILQYLRMGLPTGNDNERARDLHYGLWICDLFIHRAVNKLNWSLFSEDTAPGLSELYDGMKVCSKCHWCANNAYGKYMGAPAETQCDVHDYQYVDAFSQLYMRYEKARLAVDVVKTETIMTAIGESIRKTGKPYICYKDHVNRMSNQSGIGTIKSSNLCTEIMEWSSDESYACCTLASISLKKFLTRARASDSRTYTFDHEKLGNIVRQMVRNLDLVIDVNLYPVKQCVKNSRDYRPIGIGIQGLADVYAMMRIPFMSPAAEKLELEIMETIYYHAISESVALAKIRGAFVGFSISPAAEGILAPDLWLENHKYMRAAGLSVNDVELYSGRYDFDALRAEVRATGTRNSLIVALMPTVSTSQIMGNNESFEPFHANIYTKKTQSGKYLVTNTYMIDHLIELGLWTPTIKNEIVNNDGRLGGIAAIPSEIANIYATMSEIPQKYLQARAATRQAFVCQSQSLNLRPSSNSNATINAIIFGGWKLGLKTGSYYIMTQAPVSAMKTNVAETAALVEAQVEQCNMLEGCESCHS